jgi:beta-lactamase class A
LLSDVDWLRAARPRPPASQSGLQRVDAGSTNDVGVVWPPGRAPIVIAAYLTETSKPDEQRNATLAAVGRAVASAL